MADAQAGGRESIQIRADGRTGAVVIRVLRIAALLYRRAMVDGWFVDTMPDLNTRQPLLAEYLIQNTLWWIEFAGLSGIREDTYPYADKGLLQRWGQRVLREYPRLTLVGEEMSDHPPRVIGTEARPAPGWALNSGAWTTICLPVR